MNHIAAASDAFNAFGSISCMLIVKCIWTSHMEFVLYKLIIIINIIIIMSTKKQTLEAFVAASHLYAKFDCLVASRISNF